MLLCIASDVRVTWWRTTVKVLFNVNFASSSSHVRTLSQHRHQLRTAHEAHSCSSCVRIILVFSQASNTEEGCFNVIVGPKFCCLLLPCCSFAHFSVVLSCLFDLICTFVNSNFMTSLCIFFFFFYIFCKHRLPWALNHLNQNLCLWIKSHFSPFLILVQVMR